MLKCCAVLTAFPLPKPSPGDFGNFTAQAQIGICRFTTHIFRQELSFTLLDAMWRLSLACLSQPLSLRHRTVLCSLSLGSCFSKSQQSQKPVHFLSSNIAPPNISMKFALTLGKVFQVLTSLFSVTTKVAPSLLCSTAFLYVCLWEDWRVSSCHSFPGIWES